ncbi:MAG: zf-HC2 domain-containing protein [Candidatus Omnitrophica bacterium]|nr:zf-HC2 domain-containing protein [Candidatus Omnitrophota bacterium]
MKKCEYFKDLLLTDYIDGELAQKIKLELDNHLLVCPDCRVFAQEVKKRTVQPFYNVSAQPVPGVIWETVRERIAGKQEQYNPLEEFIRGLKNLFLLPKPVPVLASVMLMFLAGSAALYTIQVNQTKEKDQGEFLVSLLDSNGWGSQADNNSFGTPIEHYFL